MKGRVLLVALGLVGLVTLWLLPLRLLPTTLRALPIVQPLTAAPASLPPEPLDDRPWEQLADGRLVIELGPARFAVETGVSREADRSIATLTAWPGRRDLPISTVIRDPGRARTILSPASQIVLDVNFSTSIQDESFLLNRYPRADLPRVRFMFLTAHAAPTGDSPCGTVWLEPGRSNLAPIACDERRDLIIDPRASADAPFLPRLGPLPTRPGSPGPDATVQELQRSLDRLAIGGIELVLNPTLRGRYGAGPVIIGCNNFFGSSALLSSCRAAAYLSANTSIEYWFDYVEHPQERWLEGHERIVKMARDILVLKKLEGP